MDTPHPRPERAKEFTILELRLTICRQDTNGFTIVLLGKKKAKSQKWL